MRVILMGMFCEWLGVGEGGGMEADRVGLKGKGLRGKGLRE